MIIVCIGDSLTEGDYGTKVIPSWANVQEKNYPYFLQKLTGVTVRNCGKCGYTASLYVDYYKSGAVKVDDADMILIMLGTNGGHSNTEETKGNQDYRDLIAMLQRDSKAKIYLITPPYCSENPIYPSHYFVNQVKVSVEFVRRTAKELGLPLIDINKSTKFCPENDVEYQGNDGLHFIEKGYQVLAEEIYQGIKENF